MYIPDNLDALLRRKLLAQALTEAGFPTAAATLASKATRGGGPVFRLYGRIPLYRWGDAIEWAQSRLSAPIRSTSESDVHVRPVAASHLSSKTRKKADMGLALRSTSEADTS